MPQTKKLKENHAIIMYALKFEYMKIRFIVEAFIEV